ncbi:hypothetical protein [Chlorobium phaeovibrioides]|uniref:hypothetical protein n=1 Tax=Chlorobium phaeovibrioides TaxID=1094 RepID=UPI00174D740F|nr:hypothetical protein [Chlorobium phaeovibrioides]
MNRENAVEHYRELVLPDTDIDADAIAFSTKRIGSFNPFVPLIDPGVFVKA